MRLRTALASLATTTAVCLGVIAMPATALAEEESGVTSSEIVAALDAAEASDAGLFNEPDTDSDAEVSENPEDGVSFEESDGRQVTVGLPNADFANSGTEAADGTITYPSDGYAADAVVPTDNGAQILVTITSSDAPTRYIYPVDVPSGGSVELFEDGAVVLDANNSDLLFVRPAWARDANGDAVPTHFETDGTSLTQVVDHLNGFTAYPVVADPSLWQIAKCAASITAVILPSARGLKLIKDLGGVTMAARLLIKAGGAAEWKAIAGGTALWILGVKEIQDNCF